MLVVVLIIIVAVVVVIVIVVVYVQYNSFPGRQINQQRIKQHGWCHTQARHAILSTL